MQRFIKRYRNNLMKYRAQVAHVEGKRIPQHVSYIEASLGQRHCPAIIIYKHKIVGQTLHFLQFFSISRLKIANKSINSLLKANLKLIPPNTFSE